MVSRPPHGLPRPSAQTGPFALHRGSAPAIATRHSAAASTATPGDGGIEGDFYGRGEMDFDLARRIRAVGPEAAPCSPGRDIPLDPPIPLSQGPRAPRRSGGIRRPGHLDTRPYPACWSGRFQSRNVRILRRLQRFASIAPFGAMPEST